jgi:hypothetical protein
MLLPCEDNYLRREVQDRRSFRVGRFDNLPINMEMQLSDIIASEIKFQRRIESLKEDLSVRYDYSTYACFRVVDRLNDGDINIDNLRTFFRNNYSYPADRELMTIIRRVDTDGDAKINYAEFSEYMRCLNPPRRAFDYGNEERRGRDFSENKRDNINLSNSSPLKNTRRAQSAKKDNRSVRFDQSYDDHMQTPAKKGMHESGYGGFSGEKTADRSGSKNNRSSSYKSPIKLEIEDDTANTLN